MTTPPILILANHIDGLGGVERVAHGLAAGLSNRGYDVALRGIRPTAEARAEIASKGYSTGFMSERAERPAGERPHPAVLRAAMRKEAVQKLEQTLRAYRNGGVVIPMQVYCLEHMAEIGIESLLADGTRIIGQYHWSYEGARATADFDRISRTYRQLDKFLLLTQTDAQAFQRHNFNNTGSMPNPLWIAPSADKPEREQRLVALSRYDEVKQLDHALRAWSDVAADFPQWRFELYGDGPLRAQLQRLIDELGIGESAKLMGVTNDVKGVLTSSMLSIQSSSFEGLPMALAESLACGVPAVAYDCAPGVSEIITDGVDGCVVPLDHISGLSSALRSLMGDPARVAEMGAAGQVSAQRFDPEHVMDLWEDLIARVQR